jgi:hypothetical protein
MLKQRHNLSYVRESTFNSDNQEAFTAALRQTGVERTVARCGQAARVQEGKKTAKRSEKNSDLKCDRYGELPRPGGVISKRHGVADYLCVVLQAYREPSAEATTKQC